MEFALRRARLSASGNLPISRCTPQEDRLVPDIQQQAEGTIRRCCSDRWSTNGVRSTSPTMSGAPAQIVRASASSSDVGIRRSILRAEWMWQRQYNNYWNDGKASRQALIAVQLQLSRSTFEPTNFISASWRLATWGWFLALTQCTQSKSVAAVPPHKTDLAKPSLGKAPRTLVVSG